MSKVMLDVEQMKQLLEVARLRGTTDNWIRLAIEWMEEASKQAIAMRDELAEYKLCTDAGVEHRKVRKLEKQLAEVNSESTKSSAERLQEKVVCELCDGAGRVYSHSPTSPTHGYPCPVCQTWYKGNR